MPQEERAVSFEHVVVSRGRVEFDIRKDQSSDHIFFYLPGNVMPKCSELAVAMATLIGQSCKEVSMDLPVDPAVRQSVEAWTGARVQCCGAEECLEDDEHGSRGIVLNFSGGFDSLAAMYLLPEDTVLLSTHYMHNYQREYDYFKRYEPLVVTTNFRALGYNLNSEAFMGACSCLVKSSLGLKYNVFGDVFEACHLRIDPRAIDIYNALGWRATKCVSGFTQVGTTMVVAHYAPDQIGDSPASLAKRGTEKYYRKQVLLRLAERTRESCTPRAIMGSCDKPQEFGSAFASDLITLYELKHLGLDQASIRSKNIPEEAIQISGDLKLSFMERLDTCALSDLRDSSDREHFILQEEKAGLIPYEREDYEERRIVMDYLLRRECDYRNWERSHIDKQKSAANEKRLANRFVEEKPSYERIHELSDESSSISIALNPGIPNTVTLLSQR